VKAVRSESTKHVTCNLCGKDDYSVKFPAGEAQRNQIVECNMCGLMYANPRTTVEEHEALSQADADQVFSEISTSYRQRLEKETLQVRDYAGTRSFLAERFPRRGKLLEIGSGFGYLSRFFREDGWQTLGVDPNAGFCKYAESEFGLNVIAATLPEADVADESVDVALMMHVIEHVPDPVDTLREIYRVLRPGGIFVMETPRYDSLMFKVLGRRERSLSCDGHIYFFTRLSLRKLAKRAGFEVVREDMVGRSLTMDRLIFNVGVVSKSKRTQVTLRNFATKTRANKVHMSINLRDMERIYLRKPHKQSGCA
jgi:SAM-dependent methyltransferase